MEKNSENSKKKNPNHSMLSTELGLKVEEKKQKKRLRGL
jgi:hypothetical protein